MPYVERQGNHWPRDHLGWPSKTDALLRCGRVRPVVIVRRAQLVPDGDYALNVPHSLNDVPADLAG